MTETIASLIERGYRIFREGDYWYWDLLQGPQSDWLTSAPQPTEYDAIKSLRAHVEALTEQVV